MDNLLTKYFRINNPSSFSGPQSFSKENKIPKNKVTEYLSSHDSYTLHKPAAKNFKRRKTITKGIDDLWQVDLADLVSISKYNDGYKYIMTCVDVCSKYAFAAPLKFKTSKLVARAFAGFLKKRKCKLLQSDKGSEFKNNIFKKLLNDNGIKHYTSENNDIKAAVVERFNRTLKNKIYRYFTHVGKPRYIDVLQKIIASYNNTIHSSTGFKPVDVNKSNEKIVLNKLFKNKNKTKRIFKYKTGDTVRVSKNRMIFDRGYTQNWTNEIFIIHKKYFTDPVTYGLKDLFDEEIKGKFYEPELQKIVPPKKFKIESVIKKCRKGGKLKYYVKWLGYPKKFNSWVDTLESI